MRSTYLILSTIIWLLLAAIHCTSVRAEVRVDEEAGEIRLEADDATLAEVLSTLRAKFDLSYKGAVVAGRRVTGIYRGSLRQVLARVLEGYDYLIIPRGKNIEVVVLSKGTPRQAKPPAVVRRRPD
jgi:hypothetical protein